MKEYVFIFDMVFIRIVNFSSCLRYFISKLFKNAKTKHFINLQLCFQSRNGRQLSIQCRQMGMPGEAQLPQALDNMLLVALVLLNASDVKCSFALFSCLCQMHLYNKDLLSACYVPAKYPELDYRATKMCTCIPQPIKAV